MENLKPVSTAGGNVKNGAATVEDSLMIPQQVNIELLSDPAILLLDIYPREFEQVFTQKLYTMFIAASFTIVKRWKQLTCPSTGEWINQLWSIQTMGYYSVL